jgi:methionyl-tRNA formyltransferase
MKIVFMGTPEAAVPTLERLRPDGHEVVAVYTQPDRPAGRGNRVYSPPVKKAAMERDLPVLQPLKLRTEEAIEQFCSHGADIAVVVAYGRILPATYLNAFPYGAVNVHFSLLPKYRGAAPVNWAIVNGETETGVTTMKMDEGLDTGDILMQSSTAIRPDETAVELTQRLSVMGAELLSETLAKITDLIPAPQDNGNASLAPILQKADGFIDWHLTAAEITNRVRGFQPYPTAFTSMAGSRLTLWKTCPFSGGSFDRFTPGEVLNALNGELLIGCGEGTVLSVAELQLEGKRRLATRDFLNGVGIKQGDKLG